MEALFGELDLFFLILLPIVAFLYASVGHGGASGYLGLMVFFDFAPAEMKPMALLLNLFVAAVSFLHYWKGGHFKLKLFLPFAITSIPMAFIGGIIEVETNLYKQILGVLLLIAMLRMLNVFGREREIYRDVKFWQGLLIGGGIGFFSGLIGIGGGIILTPIILLFSWGRMKEAAAISALFIWVNSASGLGGQLISGVSFGYEAIAMVLFAFVGGFFGGYLGSRKMKNSTLRYLLAFVLLLASAKLFIL